MPAARKTTRTIPVTEWTDDEPATRFADEQPLAPTFEETAPDTCPHCGELLAWHEPMACLPAVAPAAAPARVGRGFTYELGHRVQPAPTRTA